MSLSSGTAKSNGQCQSTPRSSPEEEFLRHRGLPEAAEHLDPQLLTPDCEGRQHIPSVEFIGARQRSPSVEFIGARQRILNPSPRQQQEIERLQEYQRRQQVKEKWRQIVHSIQNKRREEF
ncbi:uncharacterized protein MELLADRAFT_109642 [Melampsora larici-populina 98AG31]|uniref:Uncharacterized protein n=1 Tax=Melampsora larici-populina (strain 98AG31 / pathotype 3-4-7) TaxID=747676 RepID=F4RX51_MELLP|nr:uncharacterized protein MELLADRAFT_109642 [Melampsora larici-populina 98AG31]EGG02904.1 hypothetical protein MELLADRAFT_109642 [Melampsora larici-populina 98AG31]